MTISSTIRKAGPFIGNDSASTFPFTFKVFDAAEVEVVRLEVATTVETILSLTTDYTVSLNQDQDSNPGGTITLVAGALATGFNLVITSDLANLQPTDLTNQGGFYPEVINDALDRATIQIQQLEEKVDRSAKLPITSAEDADSLVADIVRIADSADNLDTVAENIDDVNTTADDIANINTVAGSIANVNTTATNISNVNTVAGDIAAVNTVAADLNEPVSEIEVVANSITNVNTVGTNISDVNTVGTNIADVSSVADDISNVNTVAGAIANVNITAANIADVITVADDLNEPVSEIETVAGSIANVNTVGNNITNVNTVAANNANVTAVGTDIANVNTVATDITNVNTVATNQGDVNTVAANIASVNTAASDIANIIKVADDLNEAVSEIEVCADNITAIDTVGTNIADVNTVAGDIANVNTVAGIDGDVIAVSAIAANVTTVANNDANVTTVATNIADVNAVVANQSNINTVAGIDSDVTAVAAVASDIPTVAANVTDITNFADVYQGPKAADPALRNDGSALQTGDLYFNTATDDMKVYTGSAWKVTGSAINGTSVRFTFTATASQTTFAIPGGYDAGFADVYMNGVKLVNGVDVTVTSGTDVVLTTGATVGDIVDVVAYGAFALVNTYTIAQADALLAAKVNKAGDTMTGALALPSGGLNVGSGQLAVDASGRVTMSAQPAFHAYTQTLQTMGAADPQKILGEIADVNRGSVWNTGNSRFTAPVSAAYKFTMSVCFAVTSTAVSDDSCFLVLMKNGSAYLSSGAYNTNPRNRVGVNPRYFIPATGVEFTQTASWIISLAAGDYIEFAVQDLSSTTVVIESCLLNGHLLG